MNHQGKVEQVPGTNIMSVDVHHWNELLTLLSRAESLFKKTLSWNDPNIASKIEVWIKDNNE